MLKYKPNIREVFGWPKEARLGKATSKSGQGPNKEGKESYTKAGKLEDVDISSEGEVARRRG